MAENRIHNNPSTLNRQLGIRNSTLKMQSEMYKRQMEGLFSENAKQDAKELGLTPAEARNMMQLLRSDVMQNLENTIAVLEHQKVRDLISSDALRLFEGGGISRPPRYPENPEQLMFYDELHSKALSYLTNKKSTGQDLMWKTERINDELTYSFNNKANSFSNYADVQESYRYFNSGNHGLTVFDLETFGGKNQYGKQQLDKITEFTFDHYESTAPGSPKKRVSGFVGLTESEAAQYTREFEGFRDFGSLTERQQVIAKSLAKIGHADTVIEEDLSRRGRFLVKRFGKEEEHITKEMILAGIEKSRKIGEEQSKFLYDGLKAWEIDFADAILEMQKGDMTVAGHNINKFDIPAINQFLSQGASPELRKYMRSKGFSGQLNLPSHRVLDMLSILQMADTNPDAMRSLWPAGETKSILKEHGHTPFQQEALVRRFFPELLENTQIGAHASDFDVEAFHKLITEAKIGDNNLIDQMMSYVSESFKSTKSHTLLQDQKQLFYSTKSLGGGFGRESLFGFKVDEFTGSFKTMDGVELAESLSPSRTFPEYLTKKGVSYTIDSIEEIKTNRDYIDRMKDVNPALAVDELVAVKISPVTDPTSAGPYAELIEKNTAPSYIIGPREDIKSYFSNNMILYGEKDGSGKYRLVDGAEEHLSKHRLVQSGDRVILEATDPEDIVKEVIKDGTFININDSAARNFRENKMSRYEGLARFSEELNRMAEQDTSDLPIEEKKKLALSKMIESSKEVAQVTSEGRAHTLNSQVRNTAALQDLLGYKDFKSGNQVVHPKTIDNAIASLQHYESIAEEINILLDEVNKRTQGSSKAEKSYLFSQGLEAIQARALEKTSKQHADLIDGFVRGFEMDYFEVDVSSLSRERRGTPIAKAMEDVNPEGILRVDLRPGGEHKLIRSLLDDTKKVNTEQEAIKQLQSLVGVLQEENGLLKDFYGKDRKQFFESNTSTTFARKIIDELAAVRENDPIAGFLSINKIHNVQGSSELAGALTEEEIRETLSERFSRFRPGSVMSISEDPSRLRSQARTIVEEILMDPFNEETLSSYGYSSEQIKKLKVARDVREKDYITYVENLLEGVAKTNMSVIADSKTGLFGLIDRGEFIDLKNVPRERFTDGIFYTQIGRNRVATELHLSVGSTPSETKLTSGLSEAMKESGWNLSRSIENALRRGDDPEEKVLQWVSSIARTIREGSAISMFDEQDMKSQFEMYEKGVINALPDTTGLNSLDLEKKEDFLRAVSSGRFSFETMSDTDKQLWALNRHTILRHVAGQSGDQTIIDLVNNISSRGKHSAIEAGRVRIDPVQSELEYFNRSSRDIENQVRYLAFREDYAREKLDEFERQGMAGRVDLGAPLRTGLGHQMASRVYEGTSQKAYTEFVASRIALTADGYKEKLIQAKRSLTNAEEIAAIDTLLIRGNLTEGGAIGDARIADALFQNYDRQKISFARELFLNHEDNIEQIRAVAGLSKVVPKLVITDDGKIEFEYQKGRHVNRFDKLFDELGYGDSVTPIGAKYEGVLRFGFFTKGQNMVADEEDVIRNVTDLARDKGIEIRSQGQFMSLAEEIYDASFYVEKLSAEPYRKVMEDRLEKHMTAFAYYGLGESGDKRILRALSGLGLEDKRGHVLDRRFFDELLDEKNISDSVLADISTKNLTTESYIKAVTDAGFKDAGEFRQALTHERYLPSKVMEKVLGANMALVNEDMGHQNIMVPVTTAINNMLDNETRSIMEESGGRITRPEAYRQATANIFDEIKDVFIRDGKPGLTLDEDGRIVLPELSHFREDEIDTNRLRTVYDARMGENQFDKIMDIGQVTRHTYALQQDYTGITGSGVLARPSLIRLEDGTVIPSKLSERDRIINAMSKGAKITDREINMLETTRFDQALIDRMSKELSPEDFESAFGHAVRDVDGSYVLRDEFEGRAILGDYTDELRRLQFAKPGEALVTPEEAPEYLRKTVEALGDVSGGNVGLQTAEEVYSIKMNTLAMEFNNKPGDVSQLTREGFRVVRLSEIDRMTGGDGSYLLNDSLESLYRSNIVIDLQDDVITPDIIKNTAHGNRYLALGQLPAGKVGENLIQQGPHRLVGSMISARNNLIDTSMLTDAEVGYEREKIINAIDEFNNEISKTVTSKTGLIRGVSELRLERSTTGKASLMDIQDILDKDGFPDILDNVKVDGKSIMDHHRAGTLMDFKILPIEQFENMGVFDQGYLDELGMTKEQMKTQLRSGVMGFSHRSPTIYEGSVRPTILILGDNLHGTQAIEYAAGALSSHMDSDGDAPRTWLASYTNKDGQTIDSIQYSAISKNDKIDEHVETSFRNQKAMMYRNAVVTNRYFSDKLAQDIEELKAIDTRELLLMNSTSPSGRIRPGLERKASEAEHTELMDRYRRVNSIAITEKINATPALKALSDTAARNEAWMMLEDDMGEHTKYLRRAIETLDPSVQEDYSKAADYYLHSVRDMATDLSKLKRSSAGEINLPIYQINKIRNLSHDVLTSDEHRFLTHTLEAAEEAFLSPKHSDAKIVDNALTMQEFNRALRSISGSPLRGDAAGTQLMEQWFETNLPGRFRTDMFKGEVDQDKIFKESAKMIQRVFQDRESINQYNMFMSAVGSRKDGIDPTRIRDAMIYPEESKDLLAQTYRALEKLDAGHKSVDTTKRRVYQDSTEYLETKWKPPTDPNLSTTVRNVLESAQTRIAKHNLTGKDLAFGALGIAGAVMVAGFVGGNPSKPATTQAAQQPEGMYDIPMMADQDIAMQQGHNGGYVININANSERGRAHAEQAIQQAMAQSYNSTNINVSMNIRDTSGNITDRNIENLIRGSFS